MHRQQCKAFRRRITKLDHAFGINAVTLGAEGEQGGFLGGVIGGGGDARGKCGEQSGFLSRIGAEDHHRSPAEGEGSDGGGGGDGHRVRHGSAAGAKAAMVQPFAEDHGAGAQVCARCCGGCRMLRGEKPGRESSLMALVLRGRYLIWVP